MAETRNQRIGSRSLLCPDCNEIVSKSTYYRYRDKIFSQVANEWRTANRAGHDETSGIGNILIARMHCGY